MFLKNLRRRRIRTLLTVVGIAIGVAAIIALGAMTDGLAVGYNAILTGSKADLIVSQPDAFDVSYSAVSEEVGEQLRQQPEVAELSAMIQGLVQAENQPFFFVFGYPKDSFVFERFQITSGVSLDSREASPHRGKPVLLGATAAKVMKKQVGDIIRFNTSAFRIIGIYETGDAFEDSGAVLELDAAQELLGKSHQVSLYYLRLKDVALRERFTERFKRLFPDLSLSSSQEFADKQLLAQYMGAYVWVIGGLAILIGGVGMMNSQLMSVMERTREIGVLRALGWSRRRVMWMILAESLVVCLFGGILGVGIGYLLLRWLSSSTVLMGLGSTNIRPGLLYEALVVVVVLGLTGGLYPAWRASRMQPVEALRYEGGTGGKARRLPIGGMALQSLWQRTARTVLTLSVIGLTVGSVMALQNMVMGFTDQFSKMLTGSQVEIMIRQSNISDTEFSVIDERIGEKIAAMPEVHSVSGITFTVVMMPNSSNFFILWGYAPNELAIQRFRIVEGKPLTSNHQMLLGRIMADTLKLGVGDSLDLSGIRFRIVGIYETGLGWEELGGVATLRDVQIFTGRPRKVLMYAVKLHDPSQAERLVKAINGQFPEIHASLAGDFVEDMPDMNTLDVLINTITLLSVLVGGVGVLNTMLMSVFERTREIGVLRALGWRSRAILGLILRESVYLGVLGGITGVITAWVLMLAITKAPMVGSYFEISWNWVAFLRAMTTAFLLGLLGGLYPAFRATRLQPVEALRYE